MERKTAHDFDQELLDSVRRLRPRCARPPRISRQGRQVRGRRRDRRDAARSAEPEVPRGAGRQAGGPAHQGRSTSNTTRRRATARCAATWRSRPRHAGKLPAVLVIHENRGLNPHIEDIARRLALDNFVAFAPDALFPLGGYPGDEDKAREVFPKLDQAKTREDFVAAADWLKARPETTGKVGAVGFCYGGGMVNFLATRVPDLAAGVAVLRQRPESRGRAEDQGRAADSVRRGRRAHQRQLAGLRDGAQGRQRALRASRLSRHAARVQQRHDAALRRGGGEARVGADARALQQGAALVMMRVLSRLAVTAFLCVGTVFAAESVQPQGTWKLRSQQVISGTAPRSRRGL